MTPSTRRSLAPLLLLSLAVLALPQCGWRGLAVGIAACLVTWFRWGHTFELINGRLVLATIA